MTVHDLFVSMVRAELTLYDAVERSLRATTPLALSQFEILRLVDVTEGCRVGHISEQLLITVGAASKAVDRLEAAGWVERRSNPANRRSSLLSLTETGSALLAKASRVIDAKLTTLLGVLNAEEREQLDSFLCRLSNQA